MRNIIQILLITVIALSVPLRESESAIELVTVPNRDSVQLTIYNSADITMVRENRTLTFKKGMNTIQFSWAGTLIDPTSLRIRFIKSKRSLDLLDTTYPAGRNEALQWNIKSDIEGPVKVEITYFTSGITWKADYVGITDDKEESISIKGFVKVVNNSGEDYPNASVRLVVGTINLVEKISDLAKGRVKYPQMEDNDRKSARRKFKRYMKKAEESIRGGSGSITSSKTIIKEGLSEYFLFSIEGKETIPNRWQKRLRSVYAKNIPLKTIYRLSDRHSGTKTYKYYEFKNKKHEDISGSGQFGETPLPDGYFKIFMQKKNRDLSFQASVYSKYIATGDKVKLNAGISNDIKVIRKLKNYKKTDITLKKSFYKKYYVKNYLENYY
ncbi:hypothetical protein ACFL20_04905, partial [Spirochaetota bacterium]